MAAAQPPPQAQQQSTRRSPSLENYRRVERQRGQSPEDEIRITSAGPVARYVLYAEKLLNGVPAGADTPAVARRDAVTLRATGMAISVAVSAAEVLKRRVPGLHQSNAIQWTELVDEYEPLVEGLPIKTSTRTVPSLTILLTRDAAAAQKNSVGYQPPLPAVDPAEAEALLAASSRGRGVRRPGPRKQQQPQTDGEEQQQPNGIATAKKTSRRQPNPRRARKPKQDAAGNAAAPAVTAGAAAASPPLVLV